LKTAQQEFCWVEHPGATQANQPYARRSPSTWGADSDNT